jgi:uncharacterized membrane protein
MLTSDLLSTSIYVTIICIIVFFVANHFKMVIATAFFGFLSSYLAWLTAGMLTGTSVISGGAYIGDEGLNQLFSAVGFVMIALTLIVLGLPVLTKKSDTRL